MFIFLMIIHVFVSLVLILVILMQAGRGGGVSEMFGGSTQTIFGTSAGKFLTKATAVCAVLFIITSLSLAILSSRGSRSLMQSGAAQSLVDTGEAQPEPLKVGVPVENEEKLPEPESE